MKPAQPISAEDRVVQTMELLTDCKLEAEKMAKQWEQWSQLQPSAPGEDSKDSQVNLCLSEGAYSSNEAVHRMLTDLFHRVTHLCIRLQSLSNRWQINISWIVMPGGQRWMEHVEVISESVPDIDWAS